MHAAARALPALLALAAACCPAPAPRQPLGLCVGEGGTVLREGRPFRGMGVNYFDAFTRTLADPSDTSYRAGFAELARRGIPFARICGGGFWPADWRLYREEPERYFRLLDGVVRAAEAQGVGLIPSLFWHSATVPDLVGEPRDQWGNPHSRTHAFMRRYVAQVVARYRDSPALWGWEFGNEYNLAADLPNAARHRPPVVPRLGTPERRSARDDLSHEMIAVAFAAFAREVRKHDPHRLISTGNSLPRPSAWHQWREGTWEPDSPEQFARRLLGDNPDPVDVVSVHVYPGAAARRFGRGASLAELLEVAAGVAARAGKPLFVGEFGAWDRDRPGGAAERAAFRRVLAAVVEARVPLAALWVYDFDHQAESWNVAPGTPRAYQLEAVAEANRRLREPPAGETGGQPVPPR
ncbi:MAG: cellulase family glycosylhydrolase [Candidatus Brocadiia bacterium]